MPFRTVRCVQDSALGRNVACGAVLPNPLCGSHLLTRRTVAAARRAGLILGHKERHLRFTRTLNAHIQPAHVARTKRLPIGASAVLAAGIVASTAMTLTPRAAADDDGRGGACRERTLRGGYGGLATGVRLIPFGPNAGKTETIIGTSLRTYDGAGRFTESAADLHGQLTGVTLDTGGILVPTRSMATAPASQRVTSQGFPSQSSATLSSSMAAAK